MAAVLFPHTHFACIKMSAEHVHACIITRAYIWSAMVIRELSGAKPLDNRSVWHDHKAGTGSP